MFAAWRSHLVLVLILAGAVLVACDNKKQGDEVTAGSAAGQGGAVPEGQGGAALVPKKIPPPSVPAPVTVAGQAGTAPSGSEAGAAGQAGGVGQAPPVASGQGGRSAGRAALQICGPNERRTADGRCAKASKATP